MVNRHHKAPVISQRPRPPVIVLALLCAVCGKSHLETGDEMLARAEMRDAWLATAVPFAVALLLLLLLILIRRRRKPDTTLPGLFRPYRAADIPRWWQERFAAFNDYRTRRRERAAAAAIERDRAIESARAIEVAHTAEVIFLLALATSGLLAGQMVRQARRLVDGYPVRVKEEAS